MKASTLAVMLAVAAAIPCGAVKLGSPFTDGMVLQRGMKVPVWGWAGPYEKVDVSFAGQTVSCKADGKGRWRADLAPMEACAEPRELKANGETVRDVLVGEVWFCAGQSNCGLPETGDNPHYRERYGEMRVQMTRKPLVRFAKWGVNKTSVTPREKTRRQVEWYRAVPEDVRRENWSTSAMGFHFALELHSALGVPVGILQSFWGGTGIDPWIPREAYAIHPELAAEAAMKIVEEADYKASDYKGCYAWGAQQLPTVIWNERIEPVAPYAFRGMIWYQGCNNACEAERYTSKMHALYDGWSKKFGLPSMKLYFVQLSAYRDPAFPLLQEAQARFEREQPKSAMVVSCDVGTMADIHPPDKEIIGARLALKALKRDYGFADIEDCSPVLKSCRATGGKATLEFDHGKGLYLYNDDFTTASGFELRDAAGKWHRAEIVNLVKNTDRTRIAKGYLCNGRFDRDCTIELHSPDVKRPKGVRYLYSPSFRKGNIFNGANLPLGPFAAEVEDATPAKSSFVDANGVLRDADGKEISIMGVNYYAPFWEDWKHLNDRKIDVKKAIRDDVAHFRRLGLDCLRLHAIDREISTKDGALVENAHLDALDYLLATAMADGMKVVLTPIAWFSGPRDGEPKGFSQYYPKSELVGDPALRPTVERYLRAFVSHTNKYTGRRYADEPGIVAFECFNEPDYPAVTSNQVTDIVNFMADAIRSTGTEKPVFYSAWRGRVPEIARGRIDGITESLYPNDIQHGRETRRPTLARIAPNAGFLAPEAVNKARLSYEFDSADTMCTFMLPAIAKKFRADGVQAAAMFQYDELALADENGATRTHYLNLVYTPGKAIAMAIAAEVFRRVPRGERYDVATNSIAFPPFRADAVRDIAEMAAEDAYYYSNGALTPPPAPEKLQRVWGVGSSPVVSSSGNGAYFLDRISPGKWRLQLYPDVFRTADPFTGCAGEKIAALDRAVTLEIGIPDLGGRFKAALRPGDYVVSRGGKISAASPSMGGPRYVPAPRLVSSPRMNPLPPRQMRADRETAIECPTAFADGAAFTFSDLDGAVREFPVRGGVCRVPAGALHPGKWYARAMAKSADGSYSRPREDERRVKKFPASAPVSLLPGGKPLTFTNADGGRRAIPAQTPFDGDELWIVEGENEGGDIANIEIGFQCRDNTGFGTSLGFSPGMNKWIVPSRRIGPLWKGSRDWQGRWGEVKALSLYTGKWLYRDRDVPQMRVNITKIARAKAAYGWEIDVLDSPEKWNLYDAEASLAAWHYGPAGRLSQSEARNAEGSTVFRAKMGPFGAKGSNAYHEDLDGAGFRAAFPEVRSAEAFVLRVRATGPETKKAELVVKDEKGRPWGTTIRLSPEWSDVRVPVSSFKYFKHWKTGAPAPEPGERLDALSAARIAITLGTWLCPDAPAAVHGFELEGVRFGF